MARRRLPPWLRWTIPILLAVVPVVLVLTPALLAQRDDAGRAEGCADRLVPDASGPRRDPAAAEQVGAEAVLDGRPGPVNVAVVAASDDQRRLCIDVAVAFVAPRDMAELPLLMPSFRGAVRLASARLDGAPLPTADVAVGSTYLAPLDRPLVAGNAAVARLRVEVSRLRGESGVELLDGNLPTVDLAAPTRAVERRLRAVPAVWSATVRFPDGAVTGGTDEHCEPLAGDEGAAPCTRVSGVDVPLLPVKVAPPGEVETGRTGGTTVRVHGEAGVEVDAAVGTVRQLEALLGPLPWGEVDLLPVPLDEPFGVTGVPGIVPLRSGVTEAPAPCGAPGAPQECAPRWQLAHGLAHQWFGAWQRTPDPDDRVVPESLADAVAFLVTTAGTDPEAAAAVRRAVADRYLEARAPVLGKLPKAAGLAPLPAAHEHALVQGRGSMAWLLVGDAIGRDGLAALIGALARADVGALDPDTVVAFVRDRSPEAAAVLERLWYDGAPLGPEDLGVG